MIPKLNQRGCSLLASAIIANAVKDWKQGNKCIKAECAQFFKSEWYQTLRELSHNNAPENMTRKLA